MLIGQRLGRLRSAYEGVNSLIATGDAAISQTYCVYLGATLGPNLQGYLDGAVERSLLAAEAPHLSNGIRREDADVHEVGREALPKNEHTLHRDGGATMRGACQPFDAVAKARRHFDEPRLASAAVIERYALLRDDFDAMLGVTLCTPSPTCHPVCQARMCAGSYRTMGWAFAPFPGRSGGGQQSTQRTVAGRATQSA